MNPLSPFAYHRRHKRRALTLAALICVATLGVCVMVRLLDFLFEQTEATERHLTRVSTVSSYRGTLDPGIAAQIRAHPDVARVIPKKDLSILVPLHTAGGFSVFGVPEADVAFLIETLDLRVKEGRLLQARGNEIVLSEEIAAALGLQVGDKIGRQIDEQWFNYIPTTMVLVGTLEAVPSELHPGPGVRLGLVSYEYLNSHEMHAFRTDSLIVVPQEGRKAEMDRFLETEIGSNLRYVSTYRLLMETVKPAVLVIRSVFGIMDVLVAFVIALAVGTINRIGSEQRVAEFGLLHAVGYSRQRLLRRLTLETVAVAGLGWLAGLALSWLLFAWLKFSLFAPALDLALGNLTPIWFAFLIPLAVIASTGWSTWRTLARLDAVAILDRGQLATEATGRRRAVKRSTQKSLSSWTFYRRHTRRGLMLVITIALMVVGVAFPAFLVAPMFDVTKALFRHFRDISVVLPRVGTTIDPGVMAQLRSQSAVARVVPAIQLDLVISVPPVNQDVVNLYGVTEDDLRALVRLYRLELVEGRLPEPHANEIVLSRGVALNRSLTVGDRVGQPVYEDDYALPTEMVVVGILEAVPPALLPSADAEASRAASLPSSGATGTEPKLDLHERDLWLGFAPYEYLSRHELYASQQIRAILIPVEGRKAEMDSWLEKSIVSEQTTIQTYDTWLKLNRDAVWMMSLVYAAIEGVVVLVAAVALAVLSYLFFSQRRGEFGTLHAIGHSRRWLVWRTVGETASVVVVAWLIGAAVCLAGLISMQVYLYAPKGMSISLFSPGLWIYTLPLPLAVVAVSTGLVVWMLSRLDPVSIIEGR
jgi:ABC-type lipoprotein release transport system permease subunit